MNLNIDFKSNSYRTICWILSVLSWLLFVLIGWIAFLMLLFHKKENIIYYKNIWTFIDLDDYQDYYKIPYYPIQTNKYFYIILFLLLMLLGTASFILYIYKASFKKDEHIFEGMMGKFSRFNFIPIICTISLFIIGTSKHLFVKPDTKGNQKDLLNNIDSNHAGFSTSLAFSLIGLASLIFIKIQTKIEQPFYIALIIKEGFYSCLIALYVYNIFYSSVYIGVYNKYKGVYNSGNKEPDEIIKKLEKMLEDLPDFMKACGIAFSMLIGIINITIGIILKDILIGIINLLIYIGLAQYFFSIDKQYKDIDGINNAEGVIDVIIIIIGAVGIGFTIFIKYFFKNKEAKDE